MNEQEYLRYQIKLLKVKQHLFYKDIAANIGIKYGTMLNWLGKSFDFDEDKKRKVKNYLNSF